jgi:hypothetical protein
VTSDASLAELDNQLRRVKVPLAECRRQHGVTADVTFVINYDANGLIDNVLVDLPPGLPPTFVAAAALVIKRNIYLPPTGRVGTLTFLDLGPVSLSNAAEINAASEAAERVRREAHRTPAWLAIVLVVIAVLGYLLIQITIHMR